MRHLVPLLALAVALAPVPPMSRNGSRGPMRRGPVRNADGGADGGAKTPTTPAAGAPPAGQQPPPADPPQTFTQADIDRAVERAVARAKAEGQQPPKAPPPADDPPAGDAAAREAAAKRAQERASKELEEARALAATERTRRHATMLEAGARQAVAGIEFVGADAADVVSQALRGMLRVEDLGQGKELVTLVDGKTELDLADSERVAAWVKKRFPSLIKAASGSGAPHGQGSAGGAAVDFSKMTPAELIAYDLKSRR